MSNKNNIDFTNGNILINLIVFTIPYILSELFQSLYNSVDAMVVGKFVSSNALAAVSVCATIATMIINFFTGMSVGSGVVVSRAYGSKNIDELNKSIKSTFTFSLILGVSLSILGIIFADKFLILANAREEYFYEALNYLRIYLAGLMFTVLYNNGAGILRAVGDSKTPFKILIIATCMNILLDLLFVIYLGLGIVGVAYATIISQFFSSFAVYLSINRINHFNCFDISSLRGDGKKIVKTAVSIGSSAGIQSALVGISNLFVVRYQNMFSTAAVAGIGIAQRMDKLVILPLKSLGLTSTTYISQNIGAKDSIRAKKGTKKILLLGFTVAAISSLIMLIIMNPVISLFTDDFEVMGYARQMQLIFLPFYLILSAREIMTGVLRGYGRSFISLILNIFGLIICRQIFLMISMNINLSLYNIYFCFPVGWSFSLLFITIYYYSIKKKLDKEFMSE